MARRKTGDKKVEDKKNREASGEESIHHVQADENSIAIGQISVGRDLSGNITIGYTAHQVSEILTQITRTLQPKPFDGRCPYKGLDVFEEEDADLFFGRERLVNELMNRVKESRTVFITGASGSGKSSLVRAGLIHSLKQGAIKSSDRWLYETMKPGREPLKDLALAFSRLKSPELAKYFRDHANEIDVLNECAESALSGRKDQHFVLFIDQFEEIFTQVNQEAERVAFINMLAHAGTVENGRVIILFAMRSDFLSNCQNYPNLNTLINQKYTFASIGGMQREELLRAIALPAIYVGLPIESELIAQIINDMKGEPDALPLMQFALKDLFDAKQAEGGVIALMLADYLKHGGIHKSLERHADATFAKLSESEQELTRSIFSGLIEIGRGTQDTKRTALFDELIPANARAEDVLVIVQKLADARLIITDEQAGKDTVTISHEKLIEAWPWLTKLVNENRDSIALQNEIASDAKEWDEHQREASYLYTGTRLANAREQLEAKKLVLSGLAQIFVDTGTEIEVARHSDEEKRRQKELDDARRLAEAEAQRAESEKQRAEEQVRSTVKLRQFTRYLSIAFIAALIGIVVAVFFGLQSRDAQFQAEKQLTIARAGELAARADSFRDKDFVLSMLLGIEAFSTQDTTQTRGVLLDNLQTKPHLKAFLIGHTGWVSSVVFSPDGKILASGSDDNIVILWDLRSQQPIGKLLNENIDTVTCLAFSPDGKTLAVGYLIQGIILYDVESQQPKSKPLDAHTESITSIAFSLDGKTLASASKDNTIILWDVEKQQPIGEPLSGHSGDVNIIAFSTDGKMLGSGSEDNTVILWDVEKHQPIGEPLSGHSAGVSSLAFSPDGKILASGSFSEIDPLNVSIEGEIILWDVDYGQAIGEPLHGHSGGISSLAFNQDGTTLASSSLNDTIILWDMEYREPVGEPLNGHSDSVASIDFSPDGNTLASGSWDNTVILWDVKSRTLISSLLSAHTDSVDSVAFSPDGKTLASSSWDKTVILWNIESQQPIGEPLSGHTDLISSVVFSPDGKMLASGSWDHTIILWDVEKQQPIGGPLSGHTDHVNIIAFSPDGKILASGSCAKIDIFGSCTQGEIILWDVEKRQPIGELLNGHSNDVRSIAFSPDGKTLASGSIDSTIILWDVEKRQPVGEPLNGHSYSVFSITFNSDGSILASGSCVEIDVLSRCLQGEIILWDVKNHRSIGKLLSGHTASVMTVAFSPDGDTLASGSEDNNIILWDAEKRQPIGEPLSGHTDLVSSVVFSPDGKTLVSASWDNTIILWDVNPQSWSEKSCQRAGRNFTSTEWTQYFPNEEYRKTCEQWPLEIEVVPTPSAIP